MINLQENEFICLSCKSNNDLTNVIEFEQTHKTSFIPMQLRRTSGIGLIFTKDSIFYNYHVNHGKDHFWGNYEKMLEEFKQTLNNKNES